MLSFVRKYLECGCKTEAYRHAYNCKNMGPTTVNARALELFNMPHVAAAVAAAQAKTRKRHEEKVDELIERLMILAFHDRSRIVSIDQDGVQLACTKDMSEADKLIFVSAKDTAHGIEVKLEPRRPYIEALCKHFGLFNADASDEAQEPIHFHWHAARTPVNQGEEGLRSG